MIFYWLFICLFSLSLAQEANNEICIDTFALGSLCLLTNYDTCSQQLTASITFNDDVLFEVNDSNLEFCTDISDECEVCLTSSSNNPLILTSSHLKFCPIIRTNCNIIGDITTSIDTELDCIELGDNCNQYSNSCSKCLNNENCGWCQNPNEKYQTGTCVSLFQSAGKNQCNFPNSCGTPFCNTCDTSFYSTDTKLVCPNLQSASNKQIIFMISFASITLLSIFLAFYFYKKKQVINEPNVPVAQAINLHDLNGFTIQEHHPNKATIAQTSSINTTSYITQANTTQSTTMSYKPPSS